MQLCTYPLRTFRFWNYNGDENDHGKYRYVMKPEMYGSLTQAKVIKEAALRSGVNQGVMKLETKVEDLWNLKLKGGLTELPALFFHTYTQKKKHPLMQGMLHNHTQ